MPKEDFQIGEIVVFDQKSLIDEFGDGPFEVEIVVPVYDLKNIATYLPPSKKIDPLDDKEIITGLCQMSEEGRLAVTGHKQMLVLKDVYHPDGSVAIFSGFCLKKVTLH